MTQSHEEPTLYAGQRCHVRGIPDDVFTVVRVTPCGATVERELKVPRLVQIRDHDGNVVREFMAARSSERVQISSHTPVVTLAPRGE